LSNYNIAQPTYTAPSVSQTTTYNCVLTVTNQQGASASDTMNVVVNYQTSTPVASAGPDLTVNSGQSVVLLGSGSNPNGGSVTFSWSCTGGNLSNYNIAQPTYTAPSVSQTTTYNCVLTVTNQQGASASDTMNVNVAAQSSTPVVYAGPDLTVASGQSVVLLGSGSNPNGGTVSFSWTCGAGSLSNYNIAQPTYTAPTVNQNTTYVCNLVVTNNQGSSASDAMNVNVTTQSSNPVVYAGPDFTVASGQSVILLGSGSNSNGGTLNYSWTCGAGSLSNYNIAQPTYTAPYVSQNTTYSCSLTVTNNQGVSASDAMNVNVTNQSSTPVANAGPDLTVDPNQSVVLLGSGYNQNGGSVNFSWFCNGGFLSNSGIAQPTFYASNLYQNTSVVCTLTVTNSSGISNSDSTTVSIGGTGLVINVQTESPTNINISTATLNGYISGNSFWNNGTVHVWFQWGQTTYYGSESVHQLMTSSNYFNQNIIGLNPNTTYHFRAVAQNPNGTLVYGQDLTFVTLQSTVVYNGSNLFTVSKTCKDVTQGNQNWVSTINSVSPSDSLTFMVTIRSNTNQTVHNVLVKDNLPVALTLMNNLTIDNIADSRNITAGINIGDLGPYQTKTLIYSTQVAPSESFSFGPTTVSNTVTVSSTGTGNNSATSGVIINIFKSGVLGATTVNTGLLDGGLFWGSLFIPVLVLGLIGWIIYRNYAEKREIVKKLAQIRKQ